MPPRDCDGDRSGLRPSPSDPSPPNGSGAVKKGWSGNAPGTCARWE